MCWLRGLSVFLTYFLGATLLLGICCRSSLLRAAEENTLPTITVGSKYFGEGYLLSEMAALLLENEGFPVDRKFGLGGTAVAFQAIKYKKVDVYPAYTGTLAQVILKDPSLAGYAAVKERLQAQELDILAPLGFENNYGVAVTRSFAEAHDLKKISDLKDLNFLAALQFETLKRPDGWPAVKKIYDIELKQEPLVLEQTLAFEALKINQADMMMIYTTDGKIKKFDLKVLEDDKDFSISYQAAFLVIQDFPQRARQTLEKLSGRVSQEDIVALNARMDVDGETYQDVARDYLSAKGFIPKQASSDSPKWVKALKRIFFLLKEHVFLVLISTFGATLVAVPLGIFLFRFQKFSQPVLYVVGLLQTIPSLALLIYMIPFLGVTTEAALLALFLYSLLPILQNTYSGLSSVPATLRQAARGIGLSRKETLLSVEIPLAAPIILAGIRVATVINVGTATIAAFIGSGGLGVLIVQGLTLNDLSLMQQGAIPSALLAIVFSVIFSIVEKRLTFRS